MSMLYYGFLVLVVFVLFVDGGLEKTAEITIRALLTIKELFVIIREYFTSREKRICDKSKNDFEA